MRRELVSVSNILVPALRRAGDPGLLEQVWSIEFDERLCRQVQAIGLSVVLLVGENLLWKVTNVVGRVCFYHGVQRHQTPASNDGSLEWLVILGDVPDPRVGLGIQEKFRGHVGVWHIRKLDLYAGLAG